MNVMPEVFEVMRIGAGKYGLKNWRKQPVDCSTYYDAIWRHNNGWFEGLENLDPESRRSHLAHIIASAAIALDCELRGTLIDDRAKSEVLKP